MLAGPLSGEVQRAGARKDLVLLRAPATQHEVIRRGDRPPQELLQLITRTLRCMPEGAQELARDRLRTARRRPHALAGIPVAPPLDPGPRPAYRGGAPLIRIP